MSLRDAWDEQAENWIAWTRNSLDDSFFRFHGERFFALLPPPGLLTVDLGAGEGRVARALRVRGYTVVEVDGSPRLAAASHALSGEPVVVGDAGRVPLRAGVADLAVAFMSFQDVDDMPAAVAEASRILRPGGRLAMAIVHPINSGGEFEPGPSEMERRFVMTESYFAHRRYADDVEREGVTMRFSSEHRPFESYSRALEAAGFAIEAVREVGDSEGKWTRMPLFLDVVAVRR
jgi:SAM-dependent methyltransferase